MKKFTFLLSSLSVLIVLGIGLSSCKDDDPFVKPNLSVSTATLTVGEAGGTVNVEVVLDKGAPADITIEYELSGTALSPADYSIVGTEGEVEIAEGETSGTIQLQIVSDALYEGDETIEISLSDVDSDDVVITNDDETLITITDDDTQIQASFSTATLTVNEADNQEFLELEVVLSNPASQDVTIQFEIAHEEDTPFAVDDLYAAGIEDFPSQYIDYYIEGGQQQVVIEAGATSGKIQFEITSDFVFEDDETIELTLSEASDGVEISTNNTMTITLEQEDGRIVVLAWDDDYTDVDMDLFLWAGDEIANLELYALSANPDVDPTYEVLFIPGVIQNYAFGLGYNYYAGTADPMNFEAQFIDFADGEAEAEADYDIYPGTYTLANINAWAETGIEPAKAQTFTIVDGVITGITDPIVAPASGSRIPTKALPKGFTKMRSGTNKIRF